ncbi:MAG: carboxymuconolactone decarboxylase family protein [Mycobacteriales bacterium]
MIQLDPDFDRLVAATERHAWDIPRLTDREKVFLTVVADVCNQTLGSPFAQHVAAGGKHGVYPDDLRALIRLVAFETGYPAALAAYGRLAEVERELGLPATGDGEVPGAANAPSSPPPAAARALWHEVDPGYGEYLDLQSGMLGELTGISVRERAFSAITCDVLYQTLEETLRVHTGRALGAGAGPDDVRAVVLFTAQFGVTRTWKAFRALNHHLAELAG